MTGSGPGPLFGFQMKGGREERRGKKEKENEDILRLVNYEFVCRGRFVCLVPLSSNRLTGVWWIRFSVL